MEPFKFNSKKEVIAAAIQFVEEKARYTTDPLSSPKAMSDMLRLRIGDREREVFCVVYLDSQHSLINVEELFYGTIDGAAVYPREVAKSALAHNAAAVCLGHNHPSGVADPSAADKRITERLKDALALLDIRVLDHIIVGPKDTYSFAENGLI
jgi:DNA repair protein RadC